MGLDPNVTGDELNFKMNPNKTYTCLSTDFRFLPEKIKYSNQYELKIQGLSFTLAPIFDRRYEGFKVEVLYYANLYPVPLVVKDYMNSNVWDDGHTIEFLRKRQARFSYEVIDSNQRIVTTELEVFYTNRVTAKDMENLDEREGLRINVGKYCLLEQNAKSIEAQIV